MPNTGKPSPDCHLCRRRRVKCDLTQPQCLKCATYGVTCPGYRRQTDLLFHHEDPARAVQRRHRRSTSHRESDAARGSPPVETGEEQQPRGQEPRALDHPAVRYLLDQLKADGSDVSPTTGLDFLSELFADLPSGQCMIQAADALVTTYLTSGNTENDSGKALYCQALQSTNLMLSSSSAATDVAVATVWLLAVYELIAEHIPSPLQSPDRSSSAWQQHTRGLETLVELRGREQFQSSRGRKLFWASFEHLILRAVAAKEMCPPTYWHWLGQVAPFMTEDDQITFTIYTLLLDLSVLIHSLAQVWQNLSTTIDVFATMFELVKQLNVIDAVDLPKELLSQFSVQRYLFNIYRCVRALVHYDVVDLFDQASAATSNAMEPDTAITVQSLRKASLATSKCLVSAILNDLVVNTGESCTNPLVIDESPPLPRLRTLGWADIIGHIWVVSHISKHSAVERQQSELAGSLLSQLYERLRAGEPPPKL